jgi:lipopolysaccharide transport system ATP-binding protein
MHTESGKLMSEMAIRAVHLAKEYQIGEAKHNTLRDQIAAGARKLLGRTRQAKRGKDKFWALNDVSFEIKRGEMVGIIGHNGAGKSTLLKVLSRITEPTEGRAEVHGRVGSLLEVGTGFHFELTGRENVYLYGAILGMTKAEIDRKFTKIVEFSELERFLDTAVKHYSSGMYVRLAFAVAAHLDPEILLIDEVLSVGDLAFQRKCMEQAAQLREGDATVIVVSHNMFSIKAMCDRVLYLSHGRVLADGPPDEVIPKYEEDILGGSGELDTPRWAQAKLEKDPAGRPVNITDMQILDELGQGRSIFDYGERVRVRVKCEVHQRIHNPNFVVAVVRSDGVSCCNYSSQLDGIALPTVSGMYEFEVLLPELKLVADLYAIHIVVWDAKFQQLYGAQIGGSFHVRHELLNAYFGVFHESAEWYCGRGNEEEVRRRTPVDVEIT